MKISKSTGVSSVSKVVKWCTFTVDLKCALFLPQPPILYPYQMGRTSVESAHWLMLSTSGFSPLCVVFCNSCYMLIIHQIQHACVILMLYYLNHVTEMFHICAACWELHSTPNTTDLCLCVGVYRCVIVCFSGLKPQFSRQIINADVL